MKSRDLARLDLWMIKIIFSLPTTPTDNKKNDDIDTRLNYNQHIYFAGERDYFISWIQAQDRSW